MVQDAIIPFGDLFRIAFGVEGVVPNNEAITFLGLTDFAVQTASIFAGDNWILYSIIKSITFSAGIYIVLAGVRMLINEVVPAFKGISEKLVPNAKPALDCPTVFPFAPNAVLIGFLCSFVGGIAALAVLALMGQAGLAVAIILPGAADLFVCSADLVENAKKAGKAIGIQNMVSVQEMEEKLKAAFEA